MAMPIRFESSEQKAKYKAERRRERDRILAEAKTEYERKEKRKKRAEATGEGTWMLPCVDERIAIEAQDLEKRLQSNESEKKHGGKKKSKKEHKSKKSKKDKKKKYDCSRSDSEADDALEWVEKSESGVNQADPGNGPIPPRGPIGPKLERDSWMTTAPDFFPTISNDTPHGRRQKKMETDSAIKEALEKPGAHSRELNPFWKNGGDGLPTIYDASGDSTQTDVDVASSKSCQNASGITIVGDGGLSYWRKALERCQDAAKDTGRSLEEIAEERYGSLRELNSQLTRAEQKMREIRQSEVSRNQYSGPNRADYHGSDVRTYNARRRDDDEPVKKSQQPKLNERKDRQSDDGQKDRQTDDRWKNRRPVDRQKDKELDDRQKDRELHDRPKKQWTDSGLKDRQSDSPDYKLRDSASNAHFSKDINRIRTQFKKPSNNSSNSEDDEEIVKVKPGYDRETVKVSEANRSHLDSTTDRKKNCFMIPRDEDDDDRRGNQNASQSLSQGVQSRQRFAENSTSGATTKDTRIPAWKKKTLEAKHVADSDKQSAASHSSRGRLRSASKSSSSTSSSSDDDGDEDSSEQKERDKISPAAPVVVKILTEQEINQLGARLVKAELMRNETLANEIKEQLEEARAVRAEAESKPCIRQPKGSDSMRRVKGGEVEEEVVVLSRTDRKGMARPLPERTHPEQTFSGKRRKKEKVSTHSLGGTRERYFDNDDQFDLKSMVEQEKLNTAEDQNQMFARLAGRGLDKTDDEFQMDDVFLQRAANKQSTSHIESREKQLAIIEHKRMAASLDRCVYCFNNIQKHLIIAIGIKVYLCLPAHRSMADGHCLIVPMQHVTQSTVCDEDIWDEIKIFRKGLTRMFADHDEDCVFMETCINLKKLPHLCIECVPMPREIGDMAPIYFKKAITECEKEWADNKKLIDLSQKDVRRAVPKGFPYFSVDFGEQGGFAHVIEDELSFPHYFGREVVGGMLDLEPTLWRKPHRERFEEQRSKVMKFAEMWKPYDWTQRLNGGRDKNDTTEPVATATTASVEG